MDGNGFDSRFDGSGWFWVVLGTDLVVGVLDINGWYGFGSKFDGSRWFCVFLGQDLMVGVLDFNGWKWLGVG